MNEELKRDLSLFFEPRSVVIIGSLKTGMSGGGVIIENLRKFGFSGKIYPVNPSYDKVLDLKVYPNINDIPEIADLAIVVTPNKIVPSIVKECAKKGVKAVIIVSDGFAEFSDEGARLQQEVVDIAKSTGLQIIGPSTIGIVNAAIGLATTQYMVGYEKIKRGNIALVSQSGVMGLQALPFENYGLSKMCDLGNKCDLDESDLLEYLADDLDTKVIGLHLEDVRNGRHFLSAARDAIAKKPVLVFRLGRTEESKRAMVSHTGSMAGEYKIYESAFKQAGIIKVDTLREFLEIPKIFVSQPLPEGNRIAIITITGGGGTIAIDKAIESGLSLAKLSAETLDKLAKMHPTLKGNPIDIVPAMLSVDLISLYKDAINLLLSDKNVDCIAITLWANPMVSPQFYVQLLSDLNMTKPITIWVYGPTSSGVEETIRDLENSGFPAFPDFETAIKAMGAMYEYSVTCSHHAIDEIDI
jgi:acyl-CoA synthetase (NDP forming)